MLVYLNVNKQTRLRCKHSEWIPHFWARNTLMTQTFAALKSDRRQKNRLCDEVEFKSNTSSPLFLKMCCTSWKIPLIPPQDQSGRVVSDGVRNTNSLKSAVSRKPGNIWTNTTCSGATREPVRSQIHNLHPIAASGPRHRHSDPAWRSGTISWASQQAATISWSVY